MGYKTQNEDKHIKNTTQKTNKMSNTHTHHHQKPGDAREG